MSSETTAVLAFGILALLLLFVGGRRGFFQFNPPPWPVPINLLHLIGGFAIYFFVSAVGVKLILALFQKQLMLHFATYSSWINFILSLLIFLFLALYMALLPRTVSRGILLREKHPLIEDVWAAFYAWMMAFPLVLFLSQFLEMIVIKIFHLPKIPEQIAVKFLKSTFSNPPLFIMAILSIIVFAPLIEELLFRGLLQSYIRKHVGPKHAILVTSACFSLFHYASGQGLGNISIILSLFVLALFLGFLYEKQGSLLAPIVLHSTFNAISVINLYLFGGFTSGL
ncbi:MAG: CPBP family intramembrane metalloprotease [Verrucomicrobia bacterium]|nr:CPBP family intramembrane metalloprotease [Verrucomicrobiota bacterium]MDE3047246.1 CPBP family intramembrane metalloprotease [Verrucomicrobiota bacterium]